ncbi:MAG: TrkH family potassium uptake protein [Eubacteriaceae bacterium]
MLGYMFAFLVSGKKKGKLHKNQDAVIVVFSWVIGIFICALPFVLTGKYNFTQAIFEAASGFSTTGLSVVDVTTTPKIFLMHRSNMLFFGGIGLVLVMMSVLSDVYGMRLYNTEGHSDKLLPNLIKSARMIISIYSGYILSGSILYIIFGMTPFDALNHSIAAVSTGGFSTKSASIGYYNSIPIEIVTIVLMLLGCTNFLVHLLLIQGKYKAFFKHCEVKFMFFVIALMLPIFTVLLLNELYTSAPEAARIALFQIVSAITTTGFQTIETFSVWSSSLLFLMILLMLIGGGAGSTAGGIKQYRAYLLIRQFLWYIRDVASHKRVIYSDSIDRFGEKEIVTTKSKNEVTMFILFYLAIFVLGSFIFSLYGNSIQDSMFEFASALGTVGLSVGITGYDAPPLILWTGTFGMIIGRLEIYIIFLTLVRIATDMVKVVKKDA